MEWGCPKLTGGAAARFRKLRSGRFAQFGPRFPSEAQSGRPGNQARENTLKTVEWLRTRGVASRHNELTGKLRSRVEAIGEMTSGSGTYHAVSIRFRNGGKVPNSVKGGLISGGNRAAGLSPERRSEIAGVAANARWYWQACGPDPDYGKPNAARTIRF